MFEVFVHATYTSLLWPVHWNNCHRSFNELTFQIKLKHFISYYYWLNPYFLLRYNQYLDFLYIHFMFGILLLPTYIYNQYVHFYFFLMCVNGITFYCSTLLLHSITRFPDLSMLWHIYLIHSFNCCVPWIYHNLLCFSLINDIGPIGTSHYKNFPFSWGFFLLYTWK